MTASCVTLHEYPAVFIVVPGALCPGGESSAYTQAMSVLVLAGNLSYNLNDLGIASGVGRHDTILDRFKIRRTGSLLPHRISSSLAERIVLGSMPLVLAISPTH